MSDSDQGLEHGTGRPQASGVRVQERVETVTRRGWRRLGGWWWAALLLVPLILGGMAALVTRAGVERDLSTRAESALADAGLAGADVTFSGRDGTVRLPAGEAGQARSALDGVRGIRVVDVSSGGVGADAAATPTDAPSASGAGDFEVATAADGSSVTITATVADEAAKQALLDAVRGAAPDARVIDQITVSSGAMGPSADAVAGLVAALQGAAGVTATGAGGTLTLTGEVADEAARTAAGQAAEALDPDGTVDNQLTVGAGTGAGASPAASASSSPAASSSPSPSSDVSAACEQVNTEVAAQLKANPVRFASGSAQLLPASVTQLNQIAGRLKDCLGAGGGAQGLSVEGHTDNTGNARSNQRLSQQRADAVKAALAKAGIPAGVITSRGYGASQPVQSNTTAAGRTANRRVEIQLT